MPKYDYLLKNWNEAGLTLNEQKFIEIRFKSGWTFEKTMTAMKMDFKNARNLEISAIKKLRKYAGISDTVTIDDITFEKNLFFVKKREIYLNEKERSYPINEPSNHSFYSDNLEDIATDEDEDPDPEEEEDDK